MITEISPTTLTVAGKDIERESNTHRHYPNLLKILISHKMTKKIMQNCLLVILHTYMYSEYVYYDVYLI